MDYTDSTESQDNNTEKNSEKVLSMMDTFWLKYRTEQDGAVCQPLNFGCTFITYFSHIQSNHLPYLDKAEIAI
jgi:hypothetical protein